MATITIGQIYALLTEVGDRYPQPATLTLLGGSALCLLGSTRSTLDIDYVGHDLHKNDLQRVIDLVAQEMQIEVEAFRLMDLFRFLKIRRLANSQSATLAHLPFTSSTPIRWH